VPALGGRIGKTPEREKHLRPYTVRRADTAVSGAGDHERATAETDLGLKLSEERAASGARFSNDRDSARGTGDGLVEPAPQGCQFFGASHESPDLQGTSRSFARA
jgi:hypothetical protein